MRNITERQTPSQAVLQELKKCYGGDKEKLYAGTELTRIQIKSIEKKRNNRLPIFEKLLIAYCRAKTKEG